MTDHDALLRAICENPAEDTPRLVFADWLDEHADALPAPAAARLRAAFIRDDIAMSQRDWSDPLRLRWDWVEKPRREREAWVQASLPSSLLAPTAPGSLFRRGFPWCISFTPSQFLDQADRLLPHVPAPTLSYSGTDSAASALFKSPRFAHFAGLRMRAVASLAGVTRTLADSPHATRLVELAIAGGLTAQSMIALVRSGLFPRLVRLDLGEGPSSAFVNHLPHAAGSGRLRELRLEESGLNGAQTERLLDTPAVRGLAKLSLAKCRIGLPGHEAVAHADFERLSDLDLSDTAPGAEGLRTLSTSATLARLNRLGYRRNHVNATLMAELAACHEVSNLRVLDLGSNAIGNAGAAAIARSPHFAGLLVVNLSYCMVGDEGVEAILESPLADTLVLLDLRGSPASEEVKEVLNARMGDRVRL